MNLISLSVILSRSYFCKCRCMTCVLFSSSMMQMSLLKVKNQLIHVDFEALQNYIAILSHSKTMDQSNGQHNSLVD